MSAAIHARDYKKLSALLTRWTGIQLKAKEHLMLGRLQPRLRAVGLEGFDEYLLLLEEGGRKSPEAQHFINALTTNKTSFFREPHHFEFLVSHVFAEARERAARTVRDASRCSWERNDPDSKPWRSELAPSTGTSAPLWPQNGAFIRQFLAHERIPFVCERLGGTAPREVYMRTDTGDAFVRTVEPTRIAQVSKLELEAYTAKPEVPRDFNPDEALF